MIAQVAKMKATNRRIGYLLMQQMTTIRAVLGYAVQALASSMIQDAEQMIVI